MGSSKKQTIGYRYYMGLHFGLCHGPVDALLEIRGGDRTAWEGNITESFTINVVAPELWGGEKKEGGISGIMDVCMGEATQMPNAYLVSQLGDSVPGFRGILSLVWNKGLIGAMNPYPKPWKFKVKRAKKGWHGGEAWYPEKAEVALGGGFVMEPDSSGWEYQVLDDHADPGYTNLTPPTEGWEAGQAPFGAGPDVTVSINTAWPQRTILWARHQITIPNGRVCRLHIEAENGAVAFINGSIVGAVNRDNVQVAGVTPAFEINLPAGTYNLTIKAFDEVGTGGSTQLLAWGSVIGTGAMNPAHIAYESLTNPDWGLGYPAAVLDLASFTAAADTFYAEGLGLCLQWARQDSVEGFIQDVMNHAGAVLAQDPRTALFKLLPIRGGYVVASLPEFRRGLNVLAVENFERAAITETVNEVTVQYVDALTGKDGSVTIQHLANIQAQGGVASQTVRYPGAPNAALAQRLGLRDLTAKAQPLCKVRLIVDRTGYGILPGEVIRWTDAKLGIVDMPMRVLQVNYGNLTAGGITLDLAEDVFGLPATSYLGQQESGWAEPSGEPQASAEVAAFEAPYVALHRTQGASAVAGLDVDAGYLAMAAAKPAGVNYGFALYTRVGAADYEETGADDWAQGGPLAAGVGPLDTVLTIGSPVGLDAVSAGDLAMLGDGPEAELVRVDAVDATAGTVTVGRGCGDTVPPYDGWPIGTRLWVIQDNVAASVTEFTTGETVDAKAVTRASGGELPLASAPGDSVTMDQRQARPYPPGLLRINDEAYPAETFGALVVTWAHRDRLLQADQLIAEGEASIGPEAGTTYTMRTYLDDVLVDTQAGIAGTSATYAPGANGALRVEVEAVRDGLTSWQAATVAAAHSVALNDTRVTVAGDRRITVGGDARVSRG